MKTNNTNVETQDRELTLTRIYDAPRKLVFEAWSSCEHLKHWWGPKEWPMDECSMNFSEGGEWVYCLRGPNEGDEGWGKAVYQEITKPEKIVYQDYFTDSKGNINEKMPSILVSVEFEETEGKTRQIQTVYFESAEARKTIVEMGFVEGMSSSLDRLEERLAQVSAKN